MIAAPTKAYAGRIRAVILDFGGVVAFPPDDAQIASAAAECDLTPEDFLRALWLPRLAYDAGLLSPNEYWSEVARLANRTFDEHRIARMIDYEIDFWSRLDDRILHWTKVLRAHGIRTALLSNLPSTLGAALRMRTGFLEHFDHVTFSFELKTVKPEPAIYEHSLSGVGLPAGEVLFLDDKEENVAGARTVGLYAELYTGWPEFARSTLAAYELPAAAEARRQ